MEPLIKEILNSQHPIPELTARGWVRTRRASGKAFCFVEINDGSCLANLQVIAANDLPNFSAVESLQTGASVAVTGSLVPSQGKGQKWELQARSLSIVGNADESYPLQKKGHSVEFLRSIAHLRPRTNLFGSVFRVRSRMAYAIHSFFQERGFQYVHTPIITASDCEGAGEMFRVTTLDPCATYSTPPKPEDDFFGRPSFLTVSGQLEGEVFATALSRIYTFGPTFRAENSHTARHASEFWMIEPEMAFCDLHGDMDLAESFIQYLVRDALLHCADEIGFFDRFIDKGLTQRLEAIAGSPFQRVSYAEAIRILQSAGKAFEFPVENGQNLQSEHERFLSEEVFKCPVTVHDYPQTIKPFYMRRNDDGETVAAMDLLVPGIGEVIGGSQREERLAVLEQSLMAHNLDPATYWWYVDLRRYGSVPHAGFGLGFERLLMLITGVANIRDVIPFARTPGSAEF